MRETILYKGSETFEAFLAVCIYFSRMKNGHDVSLRLPSIPQDVLDYILNLGVRTCSDSDNCIAEIFNDDNTSNARICSSFDVSSGSISLKYNAKHGRYIGYCSRSDFSIPDFVFDGIRGLARFEMVPFSWGMMKTRQYISMLTSDWKMHLVFKMIGIQSVLISGPFYSGEFMDLFGVKKESIVCIKDASAVTSCPCRKPKTCHDKDSAVKPCWKNIDLTNILSAFSCNEGK